MMGTLPATLLVPVGAQDHIRGRPDAPIELVEYGDYQCPYCRAAEPLIDALIEVLGADLRVAFRHFPVSRFHRYAESAAEAAEAAASQGRFWEMHRLLFANQPSLDGDSLVRLADELGMGIERFQVELNTHLHRGRVRADLEGGLRSGVRGTPTFFIDGVRFDAPPDLLAMLATVRDSHPDVSVAMPAASGNIRVVATTPH